jgi:hypothetical protein
MRIILGLETQYNHVATPHPAPPFLQKKKGKKKVIDFTIYDSSNIGSSAGMKWRPSLAECGFIDFDTFTFLWSIMKQSGFQLLNIYIFFLIRKS